MDNLPQTIEPAKRRLVRRLKSVGLVMVVLGLIAVTGARIYMNYSQPSSEFDWSSRGHSDFHNGVYFPALAFRNGVNPYSLDAMEHYPVAAPSRACPPINFVLHLPWTAFSLPTADVLFFVYNSALLLVLGGFSVIAARGKFAWTPWLAICGILLVSRPGHTTLFTGYNTLELVLGSCIALHFAKRRPWLAAVGILIASAKPTYVLPLIILMLARKNFRATVTGVLLSVAFGVGGLAWLATDHGAADVIAGIQEGQAEFHDDETEFPINTWTRVDLLGMAAKTLNWVPDDRVYLAGMLVLLIVPGILIYQITDRETDPSVVGLTSSIAILALLISIYHHSYDCLLVVIPWVGVTFWPSRVLPEISVRWKTILAVLLSVPLLNYLSTQLARNQLGFDQYDLTWQSITMINGVCLFIALLILCAHAFHTAVKQTIDRDFGR